MTDEFDEMNALISYYGFPKIERGEPDWAPQLLRFLKYLHGYAKEMVSTDSMR